MEEELNNLLNCTVVLKTGKSTIISQLKKTDNCWKVNDYEFETVEVEFVSEQTIFLW